jgi:hypothetical protein
MASQGSATGGASGQGGPIDALAAGIEVSLRSAAQELTRRRSLGVSALDAAKRSSEVGGLGFRYVYAFVMQARRELANGDVELARRKIEEALAALRTVDAQGHGPQAALERYAGATLIDTQGRRLGEVRRVERRGERLVAERSLGGVHDAAGFIDLGGRTTRVPGETLIFGRPKYAGATLVAWTGARPPRSSLRGAAGATRGRD